jgi:hypothetical protein
MEDGVRHFASVMLGSHLKRLYYATASKPTGNRPLSSEGTFHHLRHEGNTVKVPWGGGNDKVGLMSNPELQIASEVGTARSQ